MHGWVGRVSHIFFYKKRKKQKDGWKAESDMVPATEEKKREKNEVKAILQNDWRNVLTRLKYTHFTPKKAVLCLFDVVGRKGSLSFVG